MYRKKFLIVGAGGRESSFAMRLYKDTQLYAVIPHENPSITKYVKSSGGRYLVGDADDPNTVLNFARECGIDYAFVNADQPLANGVVDVLIENDFKTIGGTKEATRIEWDKVYAIDMMQKICPEFTPFYRIVSNTDELKDALHEFESKGLEVVVKPQGLTGGKGVKVMPEHLPTYQDCTEYAFTLLEGRNEKVLLVEKLHGIEFTIMGITDGTNLLVSPASYDYPFRHEGDCGAGTGGMGCFTGKEKKLPFMSEKDLDECKSILQNVTDESRRRGHPFCGIINGGFFKTREGIRFMEFNARFGDPEGINIMCILKDQFSETLIHMWEGTLDDTISFLKKSSVVKYLVAKEYPAKSEKAIQFDIDEEAIEKMGVKIFFASCVRKEPHKYETLKKSRVCAFSAVSDSISESSSLINKAIDTHVRGDLKYRQDIGSRENLEKLERIKSNMQ